MCRTQVLTAMLLLAPLPILAEGYGHLRRVEGRVDLSSGRSPSSIEAATNYPIQVGDQLRVGSDGRLEAVLPDTGTVRADSDTEFRFGRIAGSPDSGDSDTLIHLLQGNLEVMAAPRESWSPGYRIDTANASVELLAAGRYRIFTDGSSWTQVIVRAGSAEVITRSSSILVPAGQQAVVDGTEWPRIATEAAPPLDSLERWGVELEQQAHLAASRDYLPPTLHYASAPLRRHGRWLSYGGGSLWRPHVPSGWRPYHSGWWIYTPSGLTWVSTEPWGWITYHYGYWWNAPGTGWVWVPGPVYTPGSVQWYWGPTHIGWYPLVPYGPFLGHGFGIHHRYQMPRNWSDWTFCGYDAFGYRDSYRHLRTGAELARRGSFAEAPPPGVLTTDTRALTPDLWDRPSQIPAALERFAASAPGRTFGPASRHRGPTALSPLGSAALGRTVVERPTPTADSVSADPGHELSGRADRSLPPIRDWNVERWRGQNRGSALSPGPAARDGRGRLGSGSLPGLPRDYSTLRGATPGRSGILGRSGATRRPTTATPGAGPTVQGGSLRPHRGPSGGPGAAIRSPATPSTSRNSGIGGSNRPSRGSGTVRGSSSKPGGGKPDRD